MSNIKDPVVQRLRADGAKQWDRIAEAAGVGRHFPRKLVYGDRTNPTTGNLQRLIDYYARVDAGTAQPTPGKAKRQKAPA